MFRPIAPLLTNAFLIAFALDAGLSLADESLRLASGVAALAAWREVVARLVLAASLVIPFVVAATPRLPASILAPLALLGIWLNLGGAPLPLMFESTGDLGFALAAIQAVAATAAWVAIHRRNAGSSWLWSPRAGPVFSLRHSAVCVLVGIFVLMPAIGLLSVAYLATTVQQLTRGFVAFDLDGISLADRRYRRSDREIQLVGMLHIGDPEAYDRLFRSFATDSTVVLTEGVTDDSHLMPTPLSYAGAAESLGLSQQLDIREYLAAARAEGAISSEWPHIRHADVDMSRFSPKTIAFIQSASRLWQAGDFATLFAEIANDPTFEDPELMETLRRELIDDRNAQLLVHLSDAIDDYDRVVIPWGALHLPDIETRILEQGYALVATDEHPLISWLALLAALR